MPLQRGNERAMIAHTLIDLIRTVYMGRFHRGRPGLPNNMGNQVDTLLVAADVLIGDVEHRPRNASEIARHLGIPRKTVLRKLERLKDERIVEQCQQRRYRYVRDEPGASLAYVDTSLAIIRRATRK